MLDCAVPAVSAAASCSSTCAATPDCIALAAARDALDSAVAALDNGNLAADFDGSAEELVEHQRLLASRGAHANYAEAGFDSSAKKLVEHKRISAPSGVHADYAEADFERSAEKLVECQSLSASRGAHADYA